jgi:hypothetical protein
LKATISVVPPIIAVIPTPDPPPTTVTLTSEFIHQLFSLFCANGKHQALIVTERAPDASAFIISFCLLNLTY